MKDLFIKVFLEETKKMKPNYKIQDLVRTLDLRKWFSKRDSTNWYYNIYEITGVVNATKPSYKIDHILEKNREALMRKTNLTFKKNDAVMKKLNITQIRSKCV